MKLLKKLCEAITKNIFSILFTFGAIVCIITFIIKYFLDFLNIPLSLGDFLSMVSFGLLIISFAYIFQAKEESKVTSKQLETMENKLDKLIDSNKKKSDEHKNTDTTKTNSSKQKEDSMLEILFKVTFITIIFLILIGVFFLRITLQWGDGLLSYVGAIIGGGLTLFGVAITIYYQDVKRKEDLRLMYQPIIIVDTIYVENNTIYLEIKNIGISQALHIKPNLLFDKDTIMLLNSFNHNKNFSKRTNCLGFHCLESHKSAELEYTIIKIDDQLLDGSVGCINTIPLYLTIEYKGHDGTCYTYNAEISLSISDYEYHCNVYEFSNQELLNFLRNNSH